MAGEYGLVRYDTQSAAVVFTAFSQSGLGCFEYIYLSREIALDASSSSGVRERVSDTTLDGPNARNECSKSSPLPQTAMVCFGARLSPEGADVESPSPIGVIAADGERI